MPMMRLSRRPNPISRPGDLWICGEHRVLCGDARVLADVEKVLGGELADMCFTDSPYNVNYASSTKHKKRGKNRPIMNDALGEEFGAFLYDACVNILTVTKGAVYMCMSSSELDTLQKAFREAGGKWSTFVIWAKNTFTLGRSDYQRQYEPILYGWKQGADHYWCGARDQGDVWFFDKPAKNDLHPTMKPVALVERAIRNFVQEPRYRARSIRRLWHHADRSRADWAAGAADRARSEVRRRHSSALAGADGANRQNSISRGRASVRWLPRRWQLHSEG